MRTRLLVTILIIGSFFLGYKAQAQSLTFVGKPQSDFVPIATPDVRVKELYRMGQDKIVIVYPDTLLVPIGEGESMWPLVKTGHKVIITKNFKYEDIKVGDFIVVEIGILRYFHQVVAKTSASLTTRGINNTGDDTFPVLPQNIVGVAIAVVW